MPCFALWLKQSAHNGEQFLIECFPTKQKNKMEVGEKKKKSGFDWSSFLSRPHTELLPKVGDWRSICVFTELRSSLFNLGGWIVSINNCCRLISQSHKDQAAGIYGAHLDVGVCHLCGARPHTHTHTQSGCYLIAMIEQLSMQGHLWVLLWYRCLYDVSSMRLWSWCVLVILV